MEAGFNYVGVWQARWLNDKRVLGDRGRRLFECCSIAAAAEPAADVDDANDLHVSRDEATR